jgi:hypothetical protein
MRALDAGPTVLAMRRSGVPQNLAASPDRAEPSSALPTVLGGDEPPRPRGPAPAQARRAVHCLPSLASGESEGRSFEAEAVPTLRDAAGVEAPGVPDRARVRSEGRSRCEEDVLVSAAERPPVEVLEELGRVQLLSGREVVVSAVRPFEDGPVLVEIAASSPGRHRHRIWLPKRALPEVIEALRAFAESDWR